MLDQVAAVPGEQGVAMRAIFSCAAQASLQDKCSKPKEPGRGTHAGSGAGNAGRGTRAGSEAGSAGRGTHAGSAGSAGRGTRAGSGAGSVGSGRGSGVGRGTYAGSGTHAVSAGSGVGLAPHPSGFLHTLHVTNVVCILSSA
eukprot:683317-Pelagomonas_calceolata.AAC.5